MTDPLVGAWELVEWRTEPVEGKTDHPFGRHPRGQLIYTADGHMSGQMMSADRPPFSRPRIQAVEFGNGDPDEIVTAFNTFLSYAGRWERRGDTVLHHVVISSIPGWAGTALVREAELRDGELVLRTPPRVVDGVEQRGVLQWRRLR